MTKAVDLEAPRRNTNAAKESEVKVLLYGRLADDLGREVELDSATGSSVGEIRERLARIHPAAVATLQRSRAFIGNSLVDDQRRLADDEVPEFLPPVSGG